MSIINSLKHFFKDDINTYEPESNNCQRSNDSFERSAAIERAYVHEVYENCENESKNNSIRPKVAQFITNLDAGSIICDVGCGNGRYLTSGYNPSIFSVGVEKCFRIASKAKSSSIEAINLNYLFYINRFKLIAEPRLEFTYRLNFSWKLSLE